MEIILYLPFLQSCKEARFFSFTRNKDNFLKVNFYSGFLFSFCLRLSSNLSISVMASTASSSSSLDSINTYQNLEEMASRLHSKKKKKQEKTKRVSHLQDVEDMFFGLTMWDCFFLLRGKLKVKHLSLFIMGGRVGKKEWRGDRMVFRVTGGRNSHC